MRHQPPQFQPKKLHPHGRRMTQGNTVPGSLATRKKIRSSGRTRSKLLLGLLWMPEILLNDYPPNIRKKHGPMSERSKRHRVSVAIVIGAVALSLASPAARRRSRSARIMPVRTLSDYRACASDRDRFNPTMSLCWRRASRATVRTATRMRETSS